MQDCGHRAGRLKMTAAACVAVLVVKAQVYDACQPPMLPSWECRIVATVRHLKTASPVASPSCVARTVPPSACRPCGVLPVFKVGMQLALKLQPAASQPSICIYIHIHTYIQNTLPPPFRYMTLAILFAPSTPRYAPT